MEKENNINCSSQAAVPASSVAELIQKTGRSKSVIYKLAQRLGRLPTADEVLNRPNGRPKKY